MTQAPCPAHRHGPRLWVAAVAALLVGTAFGASAARESAATTAARAHLRSVIGDAACDADADCHTAAIGTKACGGPEGYVAWSSRRAPAEAVDQAAAAIASAQRASAGADSGVSTCEVRADPGAVCAAQRGVRQCRLGSGGPPGGATLPNR